MMKTKVMEMMTTMRRRNKVIEMMARTKIMKRKMRTKKMRMKKMMTKKDKNDEDEEDDDKEITLQKGKADERKKKLVVRAKRMDTDVLMEEIQRGPGQWCANVEQATEFRSYIKSSMKAFEEHVKKGKQIKKYLVDMIDDVREACMNMRYPGMNFDPEEIVDTISDLSFKAWQAMLKGVEYADKNDLKEANTKRNANIVTSDRSNKDASRIAQAAIDNLQGAWKNDCKQMLK